MESIYDRALAGTLGADDLKGKGKDINSVDPKNPNGAPGARPPLWVAASKTQNDVGRIIQILLDHRADPSLPSAVDANSTPLQRAVKTYKSPAVISALVDAGASPTAVDDKGETAEQVATKRKDRARSRAMLPRSQRAKSRLPVLLMLTGLILFVVAWANKNIKVTAAAAGVAGAGLVAAEAIKRRFGMSGVFDARILKNLQASQPADQFKKDMHDYIEETKLSRFFRPDDPFLDKIVEKAVELDRDPTNTLDPTDLTRLALYQPVLYCDDSGSMKRDHRDDHQNELAQRIASITTRLVPDDGGIKLRFINRPTETSMNKPSLDTIDGIMKSLGFNGWTEIGTNLKQKVLNDEIYTPLKTAQFTRPVLVSIITDGHPEGAPGTPEKNDILKEAILECGRILKTHDYDPKVVRFQISQIGSDEKAEKFLTSLDSDPMLRDVLYCTTERLDDKFKELRANDSRLEQWLLELLMGPILEADTT